MFTFRESIKVPKNVFLGGQVNSLSFQDDAFRFKIGGEDVLDISISGISGGGVNSDVLFIDEIDSRVGINITEPIVALDVEGDARLSGSIDISGACRVWETLTVEDEFQFNFSGDFMDSVGIAGILDVNDLARFNNPAAGIQAAGFLRITGPAFIANDMTVSGDLSVSGQLLNALSLSLESGTYIDTGTLINTTASSGNCDLLGNGVLAGHASLGITLTNPLINKGSIVTLTPRAADNSLTGAALTYGIANTYDGYIYMYVNNTDVSAYNDGVFAWNYIVFQ